MRSSARQARPIKALELQSASLGTRKALMGASLLALVSEGVSAQTSNINNILGGQDEIIVTGTKQGLTLQEANVSVEVFTEQRIDEEALFSLDDLLTRTPNVNLAGSTSDLSIRGIPRSGVGNAGQGVTSNIYLDGAPLATTALSFGFDSLWDVQQVEVLRGPQSTVQGRNALSGSVVINTKDPTYDWEIGGRARYEELNGQQFSGVVSGPIIDDQLAFRTVIDYQSTDGFITNGIDGSNFDNRENLLLRGKILAEPSAIPNMRAEIIIDYNDSTLGDTSSVVEAGNAVTDDEFRSFNFFDRITVDAPRRNDAETVRVISDLSYELNNTLTLRGIGTFEDTKRDSVIGSREILPLIPVPLVGSDTDSTKTYSGEVRLEYDLGRFSGFFGGYYFQDTVDNFTQGITLVSANVVFPVDPTDSLISGDLIEKNETQNYAFYGQTRFELNDRWTISAALRYDNEEFNTTGLVNSNASVSPESCTVTVPGSELDLPIASLVIPCTAGVELFIPQSDATPQSARFDVFLPRGAITYNLNEDFSIFFSGQRGYRAGGTFVQQTPSETILGTFGPEFITNYELGFRGLFMENRLRLNGNIFFSEITDQQLTIPGASGADPDEAVVNAGRSEIYGLELSGDYDANDDLTFYGSLGFLRAEIRDFEFATGPFASPLNQQFQNLSGNTLPDSPALSLTFGGNYDHPSGVFLNASVNYQTKSQSAIENLNANDFIATFESLNLDTTFAATLTEEVGDIARVNLRVGYKRGPVALYAYATNLFDASAPRNLDLANVLPRGGDINFFPNPAATLPAPQILGIGVDFKFQGI
ncbi:MAG: TonB-dependent receptor [Pseudomonadota bacterium]